MGSSRADREAFVSGLAGGRPQEVLALVLLFPVLEAIATCASAAAGGAQDRVETRRASKARASSARNVILVPCLEFCILFLPLIAVLTDLVSAYSGLAGAVTILLIIRALKVPWQHTALARPRSTLAAAPALVRDGRYVCLSKARAALLALTSVCILAVDFHAFPRRFAKTEHCGWSLMDAGVGLFVAVLGCGASGRRRAASAVLLRALPLVALGAVRLVSLRAVDYQSHVSEYGVEWNFFLTQAVLVAVTELVGRPPPRWSLPVASLVLTTHQAALSLAGMGEFLQSEDRWGSGTTVWHTSYLAGFERFVVRNKEGVFTIVGYLGVFYLCSAVEQLVLAPARRPRGRVDAWALLRRMAGASAALLCCTVVLHAAIDPVSRRACNAAFATWTALLATLVMATHVAADLVVEARGASTVVAALSQNLLVTFLLANLGTGAVNLFVDTLAASHWAARGILVTYTAGVVVAALLFRGRNLKAW